MGPNVSINIVYKTSNTINRVFDFLTILNLVVKKILCQKTNSEFHLRTIIILTRKMWISKKTRSCSIDT